MEPAHRPRRGPRIAAAAVIAMIAITDALTAQDGDLRPRPFEGSVQFELSLCNLG